ncbi:HNH endonuclease [Rossellomorea vietnamensis]|uniref:HNH endonuclease n=1 Tax=Rossellomorea vietnamensis TaxID=218284 RepID=UPI003D2E8766
MFAIAPTDIGWYKFFMENTVPNRINFWTPTPWNVRRLSKGDKLLFLLKAPYRKICGYGSFDYYENLSISEAWSRFGTGNGVQSTDELRQRSNKYAKKRSVNSLIEADLKREIGCIVLTDVKFFEEEEFISTNDLDVSFPNQVVKHKYFDTELPSIIQYANVGIAEEVSDNDIFIEGAKKQITVNAYERSHHARKKCLEKYGHRCCVCTFDFYKEYGEIGKNFIHVHHLVELNQIGSEYEVDPIKDLRPVCPNCHAMLHKRKPSFTIEELKNFMMNK